jgi:hypothetical protein
MLSINEHNINVASPACFATSVPSSGRKRFQFHKPIAFGIPEPKDPIKIAFQKQLVYKTGTVFFLKMVHL